MKFSEFYKLLEEHMKGLDPTPSLYTARDGS